MPVLPILPTHVQVLRKISELTPFENNSRTHSEDQIKQVVASIKQFGFTNPVLIDENNSIIAGHCRVIAAHQVGIDSIPCVLLNSLSDVEKAAYVIADNKLALNAGWDIGILNSQFSYLKDHDFNLELTGFSLEELCDLLPREDPETFCDEDECPSVPLETITKHGDVWLLGNHRLMCGDSTVITDVEHLMDGALADMMITDPPYNVGYEGKTKDALTIKNDSMSDDSFRQFLRDALVCADLHMREGAVFYIWYAESEAYNFRGACQDVGWKVRQCLIWCKNVFVMGRQDYHYKHEPCLYGWKEGAPHYWGSDRKQSTILEFNRPQRNDIHPTMKPVELIEYLILNNSKLGWIVLDLFGGSGTTIIACEKTSRNCYTMELDPKYVDVTVTRWENFTGKKAVLDEK